MGNPFVEESDDFLFIDSRDIADLAIVLNLRTLEKMGQHQYDNYMTERAIERTKPVFDVISRNNKTLFSRPPQRASSNLKQTITSLKSDCALFSRLSLLVKPAIFFSNMRIRHTLRHYLCMKNFGLRPC